MFNGQGAGPVSTTGHPHSFQVVRPDELEVRPDRSRILSLSLCLYAANHWTVTTVAETLCACTPAETSLGRADRDLLCRAPLTPQTRPPLNPRGGGRYAARDRMSGADQDRPRRRRPWLYRATAKHLAAAGATSIHPPTHNKHRSPPIMPTAQEAPEQFPLQGLTNDGWCTDEEATATCACGKVQMVIVSGRL